MHKHKIGVQLGLLNLILTISFFSTFIIFANLELRFSSGGIIDLLTFFFAWFYVLFTPMLAIFVLTLSNRKKWLLVFFNYIVFFIWLFFMGWALFGCGPIPTNEIP